MLNDDELWEKCNSDDPITAEDLGITPINNGVGPFLFTRRKEN